MTDIDITPQCLLHDEVVRMTTKLLAEYGEQYNEEGSEDVYDECAMTLRHEFDIEPEGIAAWSHSRHYDCKPVAKKLQGRWVCWLYWYGGGKHGEPSSIDWMEDAKFIEEGEPITIPTFKEIAK